MWIGALFSIVRHGFRNRLQKKETLYAGIGPPSDYASQKRDNGFFFCVQRGYILKYGIGSKGQRLRFIGFPIRENCLTEGG